MRSNRAYKLPMKHSILTVTESTLNWAHTLIWRGGRELCVSRTLSLSLTCLVWKFVAIRIIFLLSNRFWFFMLKRESIICFFRIDFESQSNFADGGYAQQFYINILLNHIHFPSSWHSHRYNSIIVCNFVWFPRHRRRRRTTNGRDKINFSSSYTTYELLRKLW